MSQIILSPFVHIFDTISLFVAELEEPKIGISGEGLTHGAWYVISKCSSKNKNRNKQISFYHQHN